jgi:hypothetical protein
MFGALQLCERVCDKCHIRRYITSWFEKHRSNITKDTSRYSGIINLVTYFLELIANKTSKKCVSSFVVFEVRFCNGLIP